MQTSQATPIRDSQGRRVEMTSGIAALCDGFVIPGARRYKYMMTAGRIIDELLDRTLTSQRLFSVAVGVRFVAMLSAIQTSCVGVASVLRPQLRLSVFNSDGTEVCR